MSESDYLGSKDSFLSWLGLYKNIHLPKFVPLTQQNLIESQQGLIIW